METEQLFKRVQWLEEERRKEKDAVALFENRLIAMESTIQALNKQIQGFNSELARLTAVITRMDTYDANLTQARLENRQVLESLDKEIKKREDEQDKVRRVEIKALDATIAELRKDLEVLPRLDKLLQQRIEEESRLRRLNDETRAIIEGLRRDEEDYTRTYRLLEDGRRQDAKRILDLQGEVAALRKRADDQRGQTEVLNTNFRKQETRIGELVTVEAERRTIMMNFIDKQNITQVERERAWKDWQSRFDTIERLSTDLESRVLSLDATQRDIKRSEAVLEELSSKVNRRINEIMEIQRLAEDRFRQEWVTFKADDQKRWTNYTLIQEEQRSESLRQQERLAERATHMEETLQNLQDTVDQVNGETNKRLQALLSMAHEWATSFGQGLGNNR